MSEAFGGFCLKRIKLLISFDEKTDTIKSN